MSPDCIHNVDNSQPWTFSRPPQAPVGESLQLAFRMWASLSLEGHSSARGSLCDRGRTVSLRQEDWPIAIARMKKH
jgi:hypothetical protein